VGVGNPIWNMFHYCNFFPISTDFELFKRFRVKAGLTGFNSDRVIVTLIANPPELLLGQGMIQSDLHCLQYHIVGMHTQYPKIEDLEFPKVLIVKQFQEKNLETDHLGRLRPLIQIHQDSNLDKECSMVI
jgi:hypothetical protein